MKNKTDYAIVITVSAVIILCAFVGLSDKAFGANGTIGAPVEVLDDPNTVVTFCKLVYGGDYVNCTRTNVWYQDFEIIKEETFSYQISVQDYRIGDFL